MIDLKRRKRNKRRRRAPSFKLQSPSLRSIMEQPDQDSSRQLASSVPAKMDSPNESEKKQPHSVQTPPPRLTEAKTQHVTPPQKLPIHRNQESESNDATPSKQRLCSCIASKCLQLYCECFASGSYCIGCNCVDCRNNLAYETTSRQEAIKSILERNPQAFRPKLSGPSSPHGLNDVKEEDVRHNRGCNCKKSGCVMKYCQCFQANVRCSDKCRCRECKNFEGSQEIILHTRTNPAVKVGSSHLVQNQTVDYVVRDGETSVFTVPNNQGVPGSSTTSTAYRSSLSDNIQMGNVKELCALLVSKSMEVAKKMSGQRDASVINDDSPDRVLDAGRTDEKETSVRVRTSQEKEDTYTRDEVYAEQEKQILLCFRDRLSQLLENGKDFQKANTDTSRKEPEDEEEQSHRD